MSNEKTYVDLWLTNVGLGYAVENFRMAGIESPRSLAELELSFFEALGVKKADDRKKLFFLVQRVKTALESADEDDESCASSSNYESGSCHDASSDGDGMGESHGGESSMLVERSEGEQLSPFSIPSSSPPDGKEGSLFNKPSLLNAPPANRSAKIPDVNNAYVGKPEFGPVRRSARLASRSGREEDAKKPTENPLSSSSSLYSRRVITDSQNMDSISPVSLASPLSNQGSDLTAESCFDESPYKTTAARAKKSLGRDATTKHLSKEMGLGTFDNLKRGASAGDESTTCQSYQDDFDELEEYLGADAANSSDNKSSHDDKATHFVKPGGSQSRKISYSSRPTVKKSNQSNTRQSLRSMIPGSSSMDYDDIRSVRSDISERSDSLNSVGSFGSSKADRGRLGSRRHSRLSTSSSSSRSDISFNKADENQHKNIADASGKSSSQLKSSRMAVKSYIPKRSGNKRLSSIPSTKIAPISPLVGLSSSQLEESIISHSELRTSSLSRRRSATNNNSSKFDTSDLGISRRRTFSPSSDKSSGLNSSFDSTSSSRTTSSTASKKNRGLGRTSDKNKTSGIKGPNHTRPSSRASTNLSSSSRKHNPTGAATTSSSQRQRRLKSPTRAIQVRSTSPLSATRGLPTRGRTVSPFRTTHSKSPSPLKSMHGRSVSPAMISMQSSMQTTSHRRPRDRSISPSPLGRSNQRSVSPKSPYRRIKETNKSPSNSGAVFVHGMPEDNSWATQIGRLRESFETEHDEFMQGREVYREDEDFEMRIRVIVRKRPMSKRESSESGEVDVIHPLDYDDYGRVLVYQPKTKLDLTKEVETSSFAFDNVFDENSNNLEIYSRAVRNLIPGVFRGKWASVFAYGQTGSGKTFTMMGSNMTGLKAGNQTDDHSQLNLGLYFLAAKDVFHLANEPEYADLSIGVSLFEIYGGKLLDLLNKRKAIRCLEDHRGKVCFPGLSEHPVSNAEELMDIIEAGALNRSTGTTSANADSSRSHAVLQLSLRKSVGKSKNKEYGRLTFIDLAGSERGADTSQACRTTRLEGAEINTSLLALKEVIRALATGSSMKRIPFRGSKLTQVLKESFVGKNSRTVMVACVAPNMRNCDHTLNTLRYTDRVKERDPQTGKLSATVAANSKIKKDTADVARAKSPSRPLTAPVTSFRIDTEDTSDGGTPPPPSQDINLFDSLVDESTLLEEAGDENDSAGNIAEKTNLLVGSDSPLPRSNHQGTPDLTPRALVHEETIATSLTPRTMQAPSNKDNPAAQSLITTHKSIMSTMLSMVKHEMTLVNSTDAHRENIDQYLRELEKISDKQLSLISTLRESLTEYNATRNVEAINGVGYMSEGSIDADGSFIDLRD